jgi:phosphatidylglycerophosphate synthase
MPPTSSEPLLTLRGRVLFAHATGLLIITAVGLLGIATLHLSLLYVQKAVAVYAVTAVITLMTVDDYHPFPTFGPANLATTARSVIVAMVTALIGEATTRSVALSVAAASVVATMLDGMDGWLARRTGMSSRFGARFDMETDALLILSLSVLTWQFDQAGAWIVLAGALRYLFIAAGWIVPRMRAALFPSWRRQAVCVAQIVGLSLVVSPFVSPPTSAAIAGALLTLLLYSFAVDTIWLWRRA